MKTTLSSEIQLECAGEQVVLRGDGTVFLSAFDSLLVADLHLGKAASFRAGGVPVPEGIDDETLRMLSIAIKDTAASEVFLLGDLIHNGDSMTRPLVEKFANWRSCHAGAKFTLVCGNHDRYVESFPDSWMMVETTSSTVGPFELIHEVPNSSRPPFGSSTAVDSDESIFQFGGHWHPVVSIGRGADQMRLPCFVVSNRHVTLPAFGSFKGGMNQDRKLERKGLVNFYPICDGKVWRA